MARGAAALAMLGAALTAVVPFATPVRFQIVTGGSMVPAIPSGALVVVLPIDRRALPGEIITFPHPDRGATVSHRIVRIEDGAAGGNYVTKGDANSAEDAWRIPVSAATGRVAGAVPYLGYAMGALRQPAGRLSIGVLVLGLVLPALAGSRPRRARRAAVLVDRRAEHQGHDHLAAWLAQRERANARREAASSPRSAA